MARWSHRPVVIPVIAAGLVAAMLVATSPPTPWSPHPVLAQDAPADPYAQLPVWLPRLVVRADNSLTTEKVELGRWRSYDTRFSVTGESFIHDSRFSDPSAVPASQAAPFMAPGAV